MKKYIINAMQKRMLELYRKGFGTNMIARKLSLGKTTVRKYLLHQGVKFRPAPKDIISHALHKRFIELYKEGLSIKQIAKKCKSTFATVQRHLHKEGIQLKLRGNPKKIKNQTGKLIAEKAYILGVIGPGDGFVYNDYRNALIALEAADFDFIKYFAYCLEKTYGIKPSIKKLKSRRTNARQLYKVRLHSIYAYNDLLKYNAHINFKEKTWTVPRAITNSPKKIQVKYLQAFADSQGSVANTSTKRAILLCSKNIRGIDEINYLLKGLGITGRKAKDVLSITGRKNIEKFAQEINFIIKRKREKLQNLISRYKFYKTLQNEIDEPKIIKLRKEGFSYLKIASSLGISTSTVWNHSKRMKIRK